MTKHLFPSPPAHVLVTGADRAYERFARTLDTPSLLLYAHWNAGDPYSHDFGEACANELLYRAYATNPTEPVLALLTEDAHTALSLLPRYYTATI